MGSFPADYDALLVARFEALLPHLDERATRLVLGAEARGLGHGGIRRVAVAAGVAAATVSRGVADLEAGGEPTGRVRRAGGGRKPASEVDPGLVAALLALVDGDCRGDPMSVLRWTTKSTRNLARALAEDGHKVSHSTVGLLLAAEGFSLQGNAKVLEGRSHPGRDTQFRHINDQAIDHLATGDPVISVDAKKTEQVGPFARPGREWRPAGDPVKVNDHDFAGADTGRAVPYGIYDVGRNSGWVNVGTDANTAAFAVESIRAWWNDRGKADHRGAGRLLITADAGGSNGYRTRLWKTSLAALAAETGLVISVCHFPPGTSKWNKIEHRLFSHITMNWRGRPLASHQIVLASIAATTTATGLTVQARLDETIYPTGIQISDAEFEALALTRHDVHGEWNYTLHPHPHPLPDTPAPDPIPAQTPPAAPCPGGWTREALTHPALTGLTRDTFTDLCHDESAWAAIADLDHHKRSAGNPQRTTRRIGVTGTKLRREDRLLMTLLRTRCNLTTQLLADLFDTDPSTVSRYVNLTRRLLGLHDITIKTITDRAPHTGQRQPHPINDLTTLDALAHNLGITKTPKIKPAC